MTTTEEKLRMLRASAKAEAGIVEEVIDIPVDIDKDRMAEIAEALRNSETTVAVTNDLLNDSERVGVQELPDNFEIPDDEDIKNILEYFEIPDDADVLDEDLDPLPPDDILDVEDPSAESPIYEFESPTHLKALVISVTDLPFIPAKHPTNGKPPFVARKYQVLVEVAQPLQLGKEYQIIL